MPGVRGTLSVSNPCTLAAGNTRLLRSFKMRKQGIVALALMCGGALFAQTQDKPQGQAKPQGQTPAPASAPQELKAETYVRRFSVGATLSVLGLKQVKSNTINPITQ